jgi:hypothetical protein
MSIRESILLRIMTNLTNTTGVGTRIYRSRVEALARSETPAIVVEWTRDECDMTGSLPYLNWSLVVRIAVVTRGAVPDQIASPTVTNLHLRLLSDITLNGLAYDIIPMVTEFETVDTDQPTGITLCFYRVRYRTTLGDIAV